MKKMNNYIIKKVKPLMTAYNTYTTSIKVRFLTEIQIFEKRLNKILSREANE